MTILNESTVEDAALEWFAELGYAIGHGRHIAPGEPAAERDSFGDEHLLSGLEINVPFRQRSSRLKNKSTSE